jgi:hypothetical protein
MILDAGTLQIFISGLWGGRVEMLLGKGVLPSGWQEKMIRTATVGGSTSRVAQGIGFDAVDSIRVE